MRRLVLAPGALFVLLGLFALFGVPAPVFAADLVLTPATITMPVDKEFSVAVTVDPAGEKINAADGNIIFDKDLLAVVNVSKEGSVFSLWTADPTYSNSDGTIVFSGGSPAGTNKKGTILTITFRGKDPGSAKVSFTKGSVLAADGKGTDVYKSSTEANITITEAAAAPEEEVPDSGEANGPTPLAPVITSNTHPKEENWYATTTAKFDWALPADATGVRWIMTESDNATQEQLQKIKGLATTTTFTGQKDGVAYFYLQFSNDSGWGALSKRKVQSDIAPPAAFEISLSDQGSDKDAPKLKFETQDETSGVDRYEIILGEETVATVRAADLINGGALVPPQEGGPAKVSIKAYDKAGNFTLAQKDLTLPRVEKPAAKGEETAPAQGGGGLLERILAVLFAIIIGGLGAWIWQIRKASARSKARLLARVAEAADKSDRVFSAMREEFEQMVNDFDIQPQLTPHEREFLEQIKEVLDLSEEVIDSSMDELKKTVREL